jgi:hypothetical protein
LNSTKFKGYNLFAVKIGIEGSEAKVFNENTQWLDETPLLIVELHDWMLPGDRSSSPFLREIIKRDFDTFTKGENIFVF